MEKKACKCALFFFVLLLLSVHKNVEARVHGVVSGTRPSIEYSDLAKLYLQTLKLSVTGELLKTDSLVPGKGTAKELKRQPYDARLRRLGMDWPLHGLTMVGRARLENIERLLLEVINAQVPGDFVECGVWRGGSSLFARAVFKVLGVRDRKVHLVDSFQGLPKATQDKDDDKWSEMPFLQVSLEDVQAPFKELGLFDHGVAFHKGFFQDALPKLREQLIANKRNIAILRMDGDMFESTIDIFYNLYDLVPVGGCVIIDDYTIVEAREAVETFLKHHGIAADFVKIDEFSAYFCKERDVEVDAAWYAEFNKNRKQAVAGAKP
jgi:Macrocin-O-methyltransferase (TylF)